MNAIYNSTPTFTAADPAAKTDASSINLFACPDNSPGLCHLWDHSNSQPYTQTQAEKEISDGLDNLPKILNQAKMSEAPGAYSIGKKNISLSESLHGDWQKAPLTWLFGDAFTRLLDTPTLAPMVTLVEGGNFVLNRAYTMFLVWGGFNVAEALVGWAPVVGGLASIGKGFAAFLMTIGLAVGIVLFYLLPLMPFMYFFFSVVNWIIEVIEAFIEMPLFALAHLRIDGDGLPGQTAYSGYMTLFGIFLRPLLIVIGLITSSLIFGGASYYLAETYKVVIFSYKGDATGVVDYTKLNDFDIMTYMIMYVYMIYLLGNSCFKLIDKIPDEMMRWVGGGRGFTGDRPVDIGNMQPIALAGYGALRQGQGAVDSGVASFSKNVSQPVVTGAAGVAGGAINPRGGVGGGTGGGGTS